MSEIVGGETDASRDIAVLKKPVAGIKEVGSPSEVPSVEDTYGAVDGFLSDTAKRFQETGNHDGVVMLEGGKDLLRSRARWFQEMITTERQKRLLEDRAIEQSEKRPTDTVSIARDLFEHFYQEGPYGPSGEGPTVKHRKGLSFETTLPVALSGDFGNINAFLQSLGVHGGEGLMALEQVTEHGAQIHNANYGTYPYLPNEFSDGRSYNEVMIAQNVRDRGKVLSPEQRQANNDELARAALIEDGYDLFILGGLSTKNRDLSAAVVARVPKTEKELASTPALVSGLRREEGETLADYYKGQGIELGGTEFGIMLEPAETIGYGFAANAEAYIEQTPTPQNS